MRLGRRIGLVCDARTASARRQGAFARALADWTVLLLAPLPFSPWLEPYHAVPIVLGAMQCLTIAVDAQALTHSRVVAAAAVAVLALVRLAGLPFALKGFGLLAQFLALVIALGLLRPWLALPASGSPQSRAADPTHDR